LVVPFARRVQVHFLAFGFIGNRLVVDRVHSDTASLRDRAALAHRGQWLLPRAISLHQREKSRDHAEMFQVVIESQPMTRALLAQLQIS
jgi:hypothetical protein